MKTPDNNWNTAIHEAGHAVIAEREQLVAGSLTIEPDHEKGSLGSSVSEGIWQNGDNAKAGVFSYLAGREATRILCDADPPGSENDEEHAEGIRQAFLADQSMDELRAETRQAIRRDQAVILAVATALLEQSTLEYDEWSIVIDAIDEGYDWRAVLADMRIRMKQFREHKPGI